jgi:dephospho-CoA kinase
MRLVKKDNHSCVVAIAGGIACGKTQACKCFKELGAVVIDADDIAHELLTIGHPVYEKVIEEFGNSILRADKSIDRRILGKIVFHVESDRKKLESIMHPEILRRLFDSINESSVAGAFVVVQIPLLFSLDLDDEPWDAIIYVHSRRDIVMQRLIGRGHTPEEASERVMSQMPTFIQAARSNFVIKNNWSLEHLENSVKELFCQIITKKDLEYDYYGQHPHTK